RPRAGRRQRLLRRCGRRATPGDRLRPAEMESENRQRGSSTASRTGCSPPGMPRSRHRGRRRARPPAPTLYTPQSASPAKSGDRSARLSRSLFPLLAERLEPGFAEILGDHGDPEAATRVEFQKEWLRIERNPRLVGHIDDQNATTLAVLLDEINRLGF